MNTYNTITNSDIKKAKHKDLIKAKCLKCNKITKTLLPYSCSKCEKYFCYLHKLPEDHQCLNNNFL